MPSPFVISVSVKPTFEALAKAISSVDVEKRMRKMMEEYAYSVERYSKQVSPRKTGYMMGSIRPDIGKDIEIGTHNVKYAYWVHEGTRFMRSRPFMKWGLEFASKKFNDKAFADTLDDEFAKSFYKLK